MSSPQSTLSSTHTSCEFLQLIYLGVSPILIPFNFRPILFSENMFSVKQPHLLFDQKGSFRRFPHLPAEIRNQIWKISVQLYPARIVDLREYRLSAPGILSPTKAIAPESSTASRPNDVQDKNEEKDVEEIVGFKSRALPPNLLYICRDSRNFTKESYTKAFGTVDVPAETWINFKKDMLYLTWDFCRIALEGFVVHSLVVHPTGQTVPHGCFFKELKQDIKQVTDLAIGGLWNSGFVSEDLFSIRHSLDELPFTFGDQLERIMLVDAQHAPGLTSDLVFTGDFPEFSYEAANPKYEKSFLEFRDFLFEALHSSNLGDWWWGLQPYPWVEFGTLVERQLGCTTSSIPPRRTDSRCATKEIRERAIPEPEIRIWLWGDKHGPPPASELE